MRRYMYGRGVQFVRLGRNLPGLLPDRFEMAEMPDIALGAVIAGPDAVTLVRR